VHDGEEMVKVPPPPPPPLPSPPLSGCLGASASTSTIYHVHHGCGAPGHHPVVAALLQRGHAKVELLHGTEPVLQPAQRGLLRLAPLGRQLGCDGALRPLTEVALLLRVRVRVRVRATRVSLAQP